MQNRSASIQEPDFNLAFVPVSERILYQISAGFMQKASASETDSSSQSLDILQFQGIQKLIKI
jgi:hypothetical protein